MQAVQRDRQIEGVQRHVRLEQLGTLKRQLGLRQKTLARQAVSQHRLRRCRVWILFGDVARLGAELLCVFSGAQGQQAGPGHRVARVLAQHALVMGPCFFCAALLMGNVSQTQ